VSITENIGILVIIVLDLMKK